MSALSLFTQNTFGRVYEKNSDVYIVQVKSKFASQNCVYVRLPVE